MSNPSKLQKPMALAVFARAPLPGQVKTRLARHLGAEAATRLYCAMLQDTLALARLAARTLRECEVVVAHTPPDAFEAGPHSLQPFWNGARMAQRGDNLGDKMLNCIADLQAQGAQRVVIIGSDAPDLPAQFLCQAFSQLGTLSFDPVEGRLRAHTDFLLGPARDGGFYLIGAANPLPNELFEGIVWSQSDTLAQVTQRAERLQLKAKISAHRWADVDTLPDLRRLAARLMKPASDTRHTGRAHATLHWLQANDEKRWNAASHS